VAGGNGSPVAAIRPDGRVVAAHDAGGSLFAPWLTACAQPFSDVADARRQDLEEGSNDRSNRVAGTRLAGSLRRTVVRRPAAADRLNRGVCVRKQNEEVAGRLPRGKIVHIEGAGHNVRRENKAQTIEVMKAFLSGT
jgi:hypothetical protein